MITKIKDKNQVTIPADIVKKLKLKKNDQLELEIIKGRIVITPVEVIRIRCQAPKLLGYKKVRCQI